MARSKQEIKDTQVQLPDDPHGRVALAVQAVDALAALELQTIDNARAVAQQLGYGGALTVGTLEDEIRFYQRRTVEDCLELGMRLVVLKELTSYGEFIKRVELLGINDRMARRFMSATLKFSKRTSKSVLEVVGTQSKLLELLVLDDGEIEALETGETVRGIALDTIDKMSVSELRKVLRNQNDDLQAKDMLIVKKDEKINDLDQKLNRKIIDDSKLAPGQIQQDALFCLTRELKARVTASLRSSIIQLFNEFPDGEPAHIRLLAAQSIAQILTATYELAGDLALNVELDPVKACDDPLKVEAEEFLAWQAQQAEQSCGS